jgi:predicted transglutaminase-like cysteine proteinase
MKKTRTFAILGLAAMLFCGAGAAKAQTFVALPSRSIPAATAGEARAVFGWVSFCQRYAHECVFSPSEPATIALNPRTWQLIVSVNRKINADIQPLSDQDHWGAADRWDLPGDGMGDCEDYQLLKRKLLAEAGLPRRAMRITVVVDEKGEGHAVLMLRTDRGDIILDNKTNDILPWHDTGYIYVKREGQEGPAWVSLGGVSSPMITANR